MRCEFRRRVADDDAAAPGVLATGYVHLCNVVYGGKTPSSSQKALGDMGYVVICYANAALQASMLAMSNVMKHLKQHGSLEGVEDAVIPFNERQKFVDYPRYVALEKIQRGLSGQRHRINREACTAPAASAYRDGGIIPTCNRHPPQLPSASGARP